MKHLTCILISLMFFPLMAAAQQKDDAKCKDHPLFNRMPDYWIHSCQEKDFDAFEFLVGQGKKNRVEGKYWRISYYPQAKATSRPSELQILRNFETAARLQGGTLVYAEKSRETLRFNRQGKDIWVDVSAEFTGKYGLIIVERKVMEQDIVANAEALAEILKRTGHCAVNGIYFDTGKSDLKPESEAAIAEIGKLLKADPALQLYVVGHTDNAGGLESNMALSQNRASAVMQALVEKHGTAAARLKSFGNGPYAPVASNDTEEGRAQNRRVELVKQ